MVNGLSDATRVVFDDERVVANAGVMLPALLAGRLGMEALIEETVDLGDRSGAANPGRKVMTLVSAVLLGADCIDDCAVLRSGQTEAVLGHRVAAPSTVGTFLRAFTFGHVRQLDRVLAESVRRAWSAGAGPGRERLIVDLDSFVGEVYGYAKQGAGYGYTHKRGYHPILATRAQTGEVVHIRARKGSANTSRGALRFVEELIPRVQRAGATGPRLLRADSGFWNNKIMARLQHAGWTYSIGVTQQKHIKAAIAIPESDWQPLADYPDGGEAQIAQTMLGRQRLIVRRTRLIGAQAELWPDWRHFGFFTNRTDAIELVDSEHRQHAVVELAIRDLKDQALAHFPSGKFLANAAWIVIAAIAQLTLRMPARWPWGTSVPHRPRARPRTASAHLTAHSTHEYHRRRVLASACPLAPTATAATVPTGPASSIAPRTTAAPSADRPTTAFTTSQSAITNASPSATMDRG